jgi:hypothetical protein
MEVCGGAGRWLVASVLVCAACCFGNTGAVLLPLPNYGMRGWGRGISVQCAYSNMMVIDDRGVLTCFLECGGLHIANASGASGRECDWGAAGRADWLGTGYSVWLAAPSGMIQTLGNSAEYLAGAPACVLYDDTNIPFVSCDTCAYLRYRYSVPNYCAGVARDGFYAAQVIDPFSFERDFSLEWASLISRSLPSTAGRKGQARAQRK